MDDAYSYNFLHLNDVINKESVCIFTDAAYRQVYNSNIKDTCCSGFIVVYNNEIIDSKYAILYNTNVQRAELYAIDMAVNEAIKYRNYNVRIFSDSLNGVLAVRERIFNWIYFANRSENPNDLNKKNIDLIMDIIYTIGMNQVPIEFYHIKGHININNKSQLDHAIEVFKKENHLYGIGIGYDLMHELCKYNCTIDNYVVESLKANIAKYLYMYGLRPAIEIEYNKDYNFNNYKKLLIMPEDRYNNSRS